MSEGATTGRIPPQNLEAEQSVLGALMLSKDTIVRVADLLRPSDFYRQKCLYLSLVFVTRFYSI